jgi:hypothetical protein
MEMLLQGSIASESAQSSDRYLSPDLRVVLQSFSRLSPSDHHNLTQDLSPQFIVRPFLPWPPRFTTDPISLYDCSQSAGLGTGLRIGHEALSLTWADLDLVNETVVVRQTKTVAGRRTIPLSKFCIEEMIK